MIYPDEFTTEDFDNYFKESDIILDISDDDSIDNFKQIVINSPIDRKNLAILLENFQLKNYSA